MIAELAKEVTIEYESESEDEIKMAVERDIY